MINALGSAGLARTIDTLRGERVKPGAAAAKVAASASDGTSGLTSPAAALAAEGAPVDTDKVATIRAAIAAGTYKIDPRAIADGMIAQDLPAK